MKIAIVHSFYRSASFSGENELVEAQCKLLREAGHEVMLFKASSDDISGPMYELAAAARVMSGLGTSPLAGIRAFQPDVVHIHNLFPNFGSTWLRHIEFPFVVSLHNYRLWCAAGNFTRNGKPCFDCAERAPFSGIVHRCYRNSSLASIPTAFSNLKPLKERPLINRALAVVTSSDVATEIAIKYGLPAAKVRQISNFVEDQGSWNFGERERKDWVYFARLSSEKGILELLENWPQNQRLDIYGSGPLLENVLANQSANVQYRGTVLSSQIQQTIGQYRGLVFPSSYREPGPLAYLHSLASGTPVIALEGSSVAEDLCSKKLGKVFRTWSEFSSALQSGWERRHPGADYRLAWEKNYSPDVWLASVEELFEEVLAK